MVDTVTPKNLDEALEIRKNYNVIPFAGGTDLMVRRRGWSGTLPRFEYPALFIGGIDELKKIHLKGGILTIGSAATLTSILEDDAVPEILKRVVTEMASPAIRNVGTIGGNVCNASPAGDTLPVLYAFGAQVVLQSTMGCREIPIEEFIKGPGKIDLNEDELLAEINIPLEDFTTIHYKKVGTRKADALSKLSFAGMARTEGGRVDNIRMAFGAVGPTVIRINEAENMLKGKKADELSEFITDIENAYANYIQSIDDQRSSAAYRKSVSLRLIEKFILGLAYMDNKL